MSLSCYVFSSVLSEGCLAASASWLGLSGLLRARSVSSRQHWSFQIYKLGGLGHPGVSGDAPRLFTGCWDIAGAALQVSEWMSSCCLSCFRCAGVFPVSPRLLQILWAFPEPPSHAQEHLPWSLSLFSDQLGFFQGLKVSCQSLGGGFLGLSRCCGVSLARVGPQGLRDFPHRGCCPRAPRLPLPRRAAPQTHGERSGWRGLVPAPPPWPAALFVGRLRGSLRPLRRRYREPASPARRLGGSPERAGQRGGKPCPSAALAPCRCRAAFPGPRSRSPASRGADRLEKGRRLLRRRLARAAPRALRRCHWGSAARCWGRR